jgi:hypothetical protein
MAGLNPSSKDPWSELDEFASPDHNGVRLPRVEGFDESRYLAENADVAAAVEQGAIASGYAHWVTHGSVEGRAFADGAWPGLADLARKNFDEELYLAKNADVAAAVAKRTLQSGFDHWDRCGRKEGRPFPAKAIVSPVGGSPEAARFCSSVATSRNRRPADR